MKKGKFILLAATVLVSVGLSTGCMSNAQKEEAANAQVVIAGENLEKVQKNADVVAEKTASENELKSFKLESIVKIKKNEVSIAELNLAMNKPGTVLDNVYANRIDSLEQTNQNLKLRIDKYERTHSDWTKFKADFNRDLDQLGTTLKRIAGENLKK